MTDREQWTDERVEGVVGSLLRIGVLAAAAIAITGGALYLARHGGAHPDYRIFRGEPPELRSISAVIGDALKLRGTAIIQLGILLLIATPIARVAFSLIAFIRQRDRTYIVITAIVLGMLLFSLAGVEH